MSAAAVAVTAESVGVCVSHSGNNRKAPASERQAKLRQKHAAKLAARCVAFPGDAVCHAIARRGIELRNAGHTGVEGNEIDDVIAREFRVDPNIVQHVGWYLLEQYERILDGDIALLRNAIDAQRQAKRDVWEDAPGRSW